ncbi:hypothetical protein [Opitutus terrae]|uniref:Uncharacterized protein n=1 Tax=Opitutus terrae (strain DSM 11246 / JCM 15787 / PB90-1) TaxID=452637 RepID=B1ZQZ7_OPITP|nr:hypothetical protein [Opitutus terrae]ACB73664.1 hypothetical protein Oter_0374 [Opitutus terrae PB90-1]
MLPAASSSPTHRILQATAADEALAEVTLATRFNEARPMRSLLRLWQLDERVHALLHRVGVHRALVSVAPPAAVAQSDTYTALAGTGVGFVVQLAALCAWRDRWGRQALLEYPTSTHGLWSALVWSGTGQRPGIPAALASRRA